MTAEKSGAAEPMPRTFRVLDNCATILAGHEDNGAATNCSATSRSATSRSARREPDLGAGSAGPEKELSQIGLPSPARHG